MTWRKSSFSAEQTACVEIAWRKSTFSATETACVQVAWHKSSFSASQTDCVEVAWPQSRVAVRDSKNQAGPVLVLDGRAHYALIAALKAAVS